MPAIATDVSVAWSARLKQQCIKQKALVPSALYFNANSLKHLGTIYRKRCDRKMVYLECKQKSKN